MNGMLKTTLAAALAALAATGAARAADVPIAPYVEPVVVGGWYLRGYIGMSNQQVDKLDNALFATSGTIEFLDSGNFDSAPIYGIGAGYQFNEWFRADVTGEYRGKSSFSALDRYDFDNNGVWDGSNQYTATKSEWLLLANAYVDLGTWWGITPYIGAGIGASNNTISGFQDINTPNAAVAYADSASKWNFAWALHAGAGWAVTPNTTVDLGYRYVDLGDAQTGDIIGYNGVNRVNNPMIFDSLTSHDIHIGVRYALPVIRPVIRPAIGLDRTRRSGPRSSLQLRGAAGRQACRLFVFDPDRRAGARGGQAGTVARKSQWAPASIPEEDSRLINVVKERG